MKPKVIDIPLHQDDRGWVYCAFDSMDRHKIKRTYVVENLRNGQCRNWHGHRLAHTYMHVINGVCKIVALNMDDIKDHFNAVLSSRRPQLFYIPAGYYNGVKSLTKGTKILVYSTLSFSEVKNDDYRKNPLWAAHLLDYIDR